MPERLLPECQLGPRASIQEGKTQRIFIVLYKPRGILNAEGQIQTIQQEGFYIQTRSSKTLERIIH